MRSTITAACCLAIIAVAGFADKPPKETPPAPQTLTTLETDVVTPSKGEKSTIYVLTSPLVESMRPNPDDLESYRSAGYECHVVDVDGEKPEGVFYSNTIPQVAAVDYTGAAWFHGSGPLDALELAQFQEAERKRLQYLTDVVTPSTDAENVSMESQKSDTSSGCGNYECTCRDCKCFEENKAYCDCKAHFGGGKPTPAQAAKPVAARESGETIYFFTADWCRPCQQMKPLAGRLHAEGHRIYSVDFDTRQDLVSKYGVTSVPQFVVVDGDTVIRRVIGMTTKERVLGTEPVNSPLPASAASQGYEPILYQPSYRVQPPQRTGWFRGRMTRSVCGPGGCR